MGICRDVECVALEHIEGVGAPMPRRFLRVGEACHLRIRSFGAKRIGKDKPVVLDEPVGPNIALDDDLEAEIV